MIPSQIFVASVIEIIRGGSDRFCQISCSFLHASERLWMEPGTFHATESLRPSEVKTAHEILHSKAIERVPAPPLKVVVLTLENGHERVTNVSGRITQEAAEAYFLNQLVSYRSAEPDDLVSRCIGVKVFAPSSFE